VSDDLAARLRRREPLVGYWVSSDNPPATERIARAGYDYVCLDVQHGLIDFTGCVRGLTAIDAAGGAGVVRVPSNDAAWIGRALDAGARGIIVPLVSSAAEAATAARACRYPPAGVRSYGPARSALRIGPAPREADEAVACIVMIETRNGLDSVDAICAVPGVDAVYVGPADLALALGVARPEDGPALPDFQLALDQVCTAAAKAGVAAGLHCFDGASAATALGSGFTFVSVASDLRHLEAIAQRELAAARSGHPADQ
jgi:4-hydroxy-2-oxoheptanedioate aldolase